MDAAKETFDLAKLKDEISFLEEELKRIRGNEEMLRRAQNLAGLGIWEYDIFNNKVTWSDHVYDIYGLERGKDAPRFEDILTYSSEEERTLVETTINDAVMTGTSYQMDCTIIDKQGNKKYVHATGQPFYNEQKQLTHLFGTISDITQRMEEKNAFMLSDFTIESISDGIFWIDENAKFYRVNNAVCKALGYTKEELQGKAGKDINPTFTHEKSQQLWKDTKAQKSHTFETVHQRKDGTTFPVEITNNIFMWEGREFRCSIVRDISERKKKEEELLKALNQVEELKNKLERENIYLREEIKLNNNFEEIIFKNVRSQKNLKKVEQVAPTDTTVLITGESGTGKELLARAVHNLSRRKNKPLVRVNCAVLPAALIESELFGHEKGAFSGAINRKMGRFELADNGTIFLDEIGELPFDLQSKLLRVIQENEFERLGGTETIKIDVRVIAATNKDLENEVDKGTFREDLFYRLNVFPIETIPLRERPEDVPLLVNHFVKRYSERMGKGIEKVAKKTMEMLIDYNWPGNVRELENIIERAMITSTGDELVVDQSLERKGNGKKDTLISLEEAERSHIIKALKLTRGKVSGDKGAAKLLQVNPKTLESRIAKLNIDKRNP
ncbi:MAG: sigma 54-interacting transcriptional regulator [Bacteroidota bacterium]